MGNVCGSEKTNSRCDHRTYKWEGKLGAGFDLVTNYGLTPVDRVCGAKLNKFQNACDFHASLEHKKHHIKPSIYKCIGDGKVYERYNCSCAGVMYSEVKENKSLLPRIKDTILHHHVSFS